MPYCNLTTDLTDVFPEIGRYRTDRRYEDWTLATGQTNTYKQTLTGHVENLFDDGIKLVKKTSIATVEATAGTFWYDTTNDILYCHPFDNDNLITATISITGGVDWNLLLTRARDGAAEEFDSFMNPLFPTPLIPRLIRVHSNNDYETSVRRTVAIMTIVRILRRLDPENDMIDSLYKLVRNPNPGEGEVPGIIDEIKNGDRVLQTQIVAREVGNFNVKPYASNASNSRIWTLGKYTGSQYEIWRLQIDTAGYPGTATYKLSKDTGTNWDVTLHETFNANNNDRRIHIGSGIYVVFSPDVSYTSGNYWDMELFPATDKPDRQKISTSKMIREDF